MKAQLIHEVESALQQTHYSEALQKAKDLATMYPDDYLVYTLYGNVFMEMDNWGKALDQYEKALTIHPSDPETYFKLGLAHEANEDDTKALSQYQTAARLVPSNKQYAGYVGRLVYQKGVDRANTNFIQEGMGLMEQSVTTGQSDAAIREGLAISYVQQALSTWRQHPEGKDEWFATEYAHLAYTRDRLTKARSIMDPSNAALAGRVAELENLVNNLEKRTYAGYNYLLKAAAISGAVLFLIGFKVIGVILLVLAALYYVSQCAPGYLTSRRQLEGGREPFIVRRLNAVGEDLSQYSFFSTSLTNLMFTKFLFGLFATIMRYGMVIMLLPYEIIKGFIRNYGGKK